MAETSIIGRGPYSIIGGYGLALDTTVVFMGLIKDVRDVTEFKKRYTTFLESRGLDISFSHPLSVLAAFLYENLSVKRKNTKVLFKTVQDLQDQTKIRDPNIKVDFNDDIHIFLASSWWRVDMRASMGRFDSKCHDHKEKDVNLLKILGSPKWIHLILPLLSDSE